MLSRREGFGNVLADSTRAVEKGHYPPEALKYRMAVKGLMQSDPHDARILKAFALGLAVATRGMDHLRNRVTLEINARINDDPAFKERLYGAPVSAAPEQLRDQGTRRARLREHLRGRRFGRHVPLHDEAVQQPVAARPRRVRRPDRATSPGSTLSRRRSRRHRPEHHGRRAADQPAASACAASTTRCRRAGSTSRSRSGSYAGEKIDRAEFDAMLTRFYEVSRLTPDGVPAPPFHRELQQILGSPSARG